MVLRQNLRKKTGHLGCACEIQMQACVVGIHPEIQTDLFHSFCEIVKCQIVLLSIVSDLLIIFRIPVGILAGGFDENQFHALTFAKLAHFVQVFIADITELIIRQRTFGGKALHGNNPGVHLVTVPGVVLYPEQILQVFCRQFVKAGMITQNREHIGQKIFFLHHSGGNQPHFGCRPPHPVCGQAVVCFADRFGVAHGIDIVYHRPGCLIGQCLLQHMIRLPDQLLGSSPDIGRNAPMPVHLHGGEIGIDLAVADENHIVAACFPVVLRNKAALFQICHVLGLQQCSRKAQKKRKHKQHGRNRQQIFKSIILHIPS